MLDLLQHSWDLLLLSQDSSIPFSFHLTINQTINQSTMIYFLSFLATWQGSLVSTQNGTYTLRLIVNGGVRLYLGGLLLIDQWTTIQVPFLLVFVFSVFFFSF